MYVLCICLVCLIVCELFSHFKNLFNELYNYCDDIQSTAALSNEMRSLRQQVLELKAMMQLSFDLQLDIQRAIRQEVAAAVSSAVGEFLTYVQLTLIRQFYFYIPVAIGGYLLVIYLLLVRVWAEKKEFLKCPYRDSSACPIYF